MPEKRPRNYFGGQKTNPMGRTVLMHGRERVQPPECPQDAENGRQDAAGPAPSRSTPTGPGKRGTPPGDNAGIHQDCGGLFKNVPVGSPRRRCKLCGEEWAYLRSEKRWERVE